MAAHQHFRKQAIDARLDRLHGDMVVFPKTSHRLLAACLCIWVVAVMALIMNSQYSRKETVRGWLEPVTGVTRVSSAMPGTIDKVLVKQGDLVSKGQALLVVTDSRYTPNGQELHARVLEEAETQKIMIEEQIERRHTQFKVKHKDYSAQIKSTQRELENISDQETTLTKMLELTTSQLARLKTLLEKGHISAETINEHKKDELTVKNQLLQISRSRESKRNNLNQLKAQLLSLPELHETEVVDLELQLSSLIQRISESQSRAANVVTAPRDGIIENLTVSAGQHVDQQTSVLTILPDGDLLIAKLLVPIQAAGFLETGQRVNIRYDAFPFEKYGSAEASMTYISDHVLFGQELVDMPISSSHPVYVIKADLGSLSLEAFEHSINLRAGMTFSADIVLESRTLADWLLEPLYAAVERL